jgi:mRNA-degrading endonuclease RelE of RelBE toxin-antitoxin system
MVLNEDNFSIIKLRVPNSGRNLSKKDGFRLLYLVHRQKEEVVFLYIYPKRDHKA